MRDGGGREIWKEEERRRQEEMRQEDRGRVANARNERSKENLRKGLP